VPAGGLLYGVFLEESFFAALGGFFTPADALCLEDIESEGEADVGAFAAEFAADGELQKREPGEIGEAQVGGSKFCGTAVRASHWGNLGGKSMNAVEVGSGESQTRYLMLARCGFGVHEGGEKTSVLQLK